MDLEFLFLCTHYCSVLFCSVQVLIIMEWNCWCLILQMDDPLHLNKFNHSFSTEFQVNAMEFKHLTPQNMDYFLVLDLEGKVEILEFPVVMIDAKTLDFVDSFHR